MNFTDNNPLQEFEKMMRRIPNFAPRGHGVVVLCSAESIESGICFSPMSTEPKKKCRIKETIKHERSVMCDER